MGLLRKFSGMALLALPAMMLGAVPVPAHADAFYNVKFMGNDDGVTFTAELGPPGALPELLRVFKIRVKGVAVPARRPKCDVPSRRVVLLGMAKKADALLFDLLSKARRIDLLEVERGSSFRLLARVLADGKDVGQALLAAALARPMIGKKRPKWC